MFGKIQNPETGRWVSVYGAKGKQILRHYGNNQKAGAFNMSSKFPRIGTDQSDRWEYKSLRDWDNEKRKKSRRRKVTRGRCSLTIAQIKELLNEIIDIRNCWFITIYDVIDQIEELSKPENLGIDTMVLFLKEIRLGYKHVVSETGDLHPLPCIIQAFRDYRYNHKIIYRFDVLYLLAGSDMKNFEYHGYNILQYIMDYNDDFIKHVIELSSRQKSGGPDLLVSLLTSKPVHSTVCEHAEPFLRGHNNYGNRSRGYYRGHPPICKITALEMAFYSMRDNLLDYMIQKAKLTNSVNIGTVLWIEKWLYCLNEEECAQCSICFESFASYNRTKIPVYTSCGHLFCVSCIKKWDGFCPMCRAPDEDFTLEYYPT